MALTQSEIHELRTAIDNINAVCEPDAKIYTEEKLTAKLDEAVRSSLVGMILDRFADQPAERAALIEELRTKVEARFPAAELFTDREWTPGYIEILLAELWDDSEKKADAAWQVYNDTDWADVRTKPQETN